MLHKANGVFDSPYNNQASVREITEVLSNKRRWFTSQLRYYAKYFLQIRMMIGN